MVEIDFLAANHVCIVGLCGQNWNRTLGYSFSLRGLRPSNVVKYLTTVEWTTRPQSMGDGHGLPWALAGVAASTSSAHCTVHSLPYRLRHSLTDQDRCPTARTAAWPIPEGMTIFCLPIASTSQIRTAWLYLWLGAVWSIGRPPLAFSWASCHISNYN